MPANPPTEPVIAARQKAAREVEGDSDNPLRVAEANAIYAGQRDDTPVVQKYLAEGDICPRTKVQIGDPNIDRQQAELFRKLNPGMDILNRKLGFSGATATPPAAPRQR